jgi:hypothetical protein
MIYTRIYSDANGDSHFEDVNISLSNYGSVGFLSDKYATSTLQFRENKEDYSWDFHTAPSRQFIVLLDGEIEIETSLGDIRRFKGGEVLLVEDISGKGHRTKNIIQHVRRSLFIKLSNHE